MTVKTDGKENSIESVKMLSLINYRRYSNV